VGEVSKSFVERAVRPAVVGTVLVSALVLGWPWAVALLDVKGPIDFVQYAEWLSGVAQPIAVFWFLLAFLLQHEELKLQRQELKETRAEVAKQAVATQQMELTSRRANFLELRNEYQGLLDTLVQQFGTQLSNTVTAAQDEARRTNSVAQANNLPGPVPWHERSGAEQAIWILLQLTGPSSNSPWPRAHAEWGHYLGSAEFRTLKLGYKKIFEALLEEASVLGGEGIFVDRIRNTHHFLWYQALMWVDRDTNYAERARGVRVTDARFNERIDRTVGFPLHSAEAHRPTSFS
jgi:hypothetical protein